MQSLEFSGLSKRSRGKKKKIKKVNQKLEKKMICLSKRLLMSRRIDWETCGNKWRTRAK